MLRSLLTPLALPISLLKGSVGCFIPLLSSPGWHQEGPRSRLELEREELSKAWLTIGLVILFSENALGKLSQAECTHKMLWVKLAPHGTDATASDGLLTPVADGSLPLMVVPLTERLPVQLKERGCGESLETVPTHEALRVPDGIHG